VVVRGENGREWEGVEDDPAELAHAAGVVVGVYSLARNVRSEEGRSPPAHRLAIAELARNEALRRGISVHALLVNSTSEAFAFTRGRYGRQTGRWAATTLDPRACDVVAATLALYEQSRLLPLDATKYFDPKAQDARSGRAYTDWVLQKWTREGHEWIGPVRGIDPWGLMVFRKVGAGADPTAAQRIIADGRAGRSTVGAGGGGAATMAMAMLALAGKVLLG
jgi:hypothetical protein